jgi:hypothetical protein
LAATYYPSEDLSAALARAAEGKQRKNKIEKSLAAGEVFGSGDGDRNQGTELAARQVPQRTNLGQGKLKEQIGQRILKE